MSDRTFKVDAPLMEGPDIDLWQTFLYDQFRSAWGIEYPIITDGSYGVATRAATASFMRAWGVLSAADALEDGLTPEWRIKLRNNDRTPAEQDRALSDERKDYRQALRDRYATMDVAYPCLHLVTDANGYSSWHDGVDLITAWRGPALAICTGKIVRVSKGGWWGNNPTPSPGHPISDGDGIIILESTITAGPFRPGMHFGYGHTEEAVVSEGDHVHAGQVMGHIGWARAPHIHFMVNDDKPVDGFYRGTGDRDPAPFLDYARRNG